MTSAATRPSPRWRALIADDEEPARRLLTTHVRSVSAVEVIAEAVDGPDTVHKIEEQSPDLVFLDIQMPGLTGLEVVDVVGVEQMPLTVFVTAYDEHALRAFHARAFDYVLKPIDGAQLIATIERAVQRLTADATMAGELLPSRDDLSDRLSALLADLEQDRIGESRITAWDGETAVLLRPAEIQRATVDGNYVRLHTPSATYIVREAMHVLESRLSSRQFARLNRSVLVNVDAIREIQPYFRGDFAVVLRDGSHVITGRTYRERIRRRFSLG
jgi:two-component system LytT family response regulator